MAIKPNQPLTKEDFEQALVTLRISVSEVSRESGIPRHIVSHFRNYGDGLKPEQAAKLRDYLESKGIEFADEALPASTRQKTPDTSLQLPQVISDDGLSQRTALVCRHFFIDERITNEQIKLHGENILDSFNQAKDLMDVELSKAAFSGEYSESTQTKIRELWGHLARIGLVNLHLQGRALLDQSRFQAVVTDDFKPQTLGDLLFNAYRDVITNLSNNKEEADIEIEKEEEAA